MATAIWEMLNWILIGFGMMLLVEGIIWGIFHEYMRDVLQRMQELPINQMRVISFITAAVGLLIVWLGY